MNVLAIVDDIAEVDAHAEFERTLRKAFLHHDGAPYGVLDGRKLGQETVSRQFDDTARMTGDGGVDDLGARGLPGVDRALRVVLHEFRVASDIGCHNGR